MSDQSRPEPHMEIALPPHDPGFWDRHPDVAHHEAYYDTGNGEQPPTVYVRLWLTEDGWNRTFPEGYRRPDDEWTPLPPRVLS